MTKLVHPKCYQQLIRTFISSRRFPRVLARKANSNRLISPASLWNWHSIVAARVAETFPARPTVMLSETIRIASSMVTHQIVVAVVGRSSVEIVVLEHCRIFSCSFYFSLVCVFERQFTLVTFLE